MKLSKLTTAILGITIVLGSAILNQSCNSNDPKPERPEIISVYPPQAEPGGTVIIKGTKFSEDLTKIKVTFAGVDKNIDVIPTTSTDTSITVYMPDLEPGQVNVIVTVDGTSSSPFTEFDAIEPLPDIIVDEYTKSGSFGETITIKGDNFGAYQSVVTVTINDVVQKIISFSNTEIQITLTARTFSGELRITRNGKTTNPGSFDYNEAYTEVGSWSLSAETIGIDTNDIVYIGELSDFYRFLPDGSLDDIIKDDGIDMPVYIFDFFTGSKNILYIADAAGRVLQYNPATTNIDTIIGYQKDSDIDSPIRITGDNNGYLYITDKIHKTIVKVDIETYSGDVMYTEPNDKEMGAIAINNGKIYYQTDDEIATINMDGSGYSKFIDMSEIDKSSGAAWSNLWTYPNGILFFNSKYSIYKSANNEIESILSYGVDTVQSIRTITFDKYGQNLYIAIGCTTGAFVKKYKIE